MNSQTDTEAFATMQRGLAAADRVAIEQFQNARADTPWGEEVRQAALRAFPVLAEVRETLADAAWHADGTQGITAGRLNAIPYDAAQMQAANKTIFLPQNSGAIRLFIYIKKVKIHINRIEVEIFKSYINIFHLIIKILLLFTNKYISYTKLYFIFIRLYEDGAPARAGFDKDIRRFIGLPTEKWSSLS